MSTHSHDGREWARLSQLKAGSIVQMDCGFTCGMANTTQAIRAFPLEQLWYRLLYLFGRKDYLDRRLWVPCDEGRHYIDVQADDGDGDHLVGIWPA